MPVNLSSKRGAVAEPGFDACIDRRGADPPQREHRRTRIIAFSYGSTG